MPNKKITVEEVIRLRDKLKEEYRDIHKEFERDDKFYELAFKDELNMPKEPPEFAKDATVLPIARQLVDVYTDHVDLDNARVLVAQKTTPEGNDEAREKAEQEAELTAKAAKGILYRSLVEEDISQPRVAAKHQGLYGLGCIKTVYDADRWLLKPEQKAKQSDAEYNEIIDEWRHSRDSSMPIVNLAINPRNLYPDPSYGGRGFFIEVQEKVMLNVRNRYPKWKNPKGKEVDEKVTLTSYWDNEYRCELADDEPILQVRGGVVKHGYGFAPYVLIESGLGNMSYDADLVKRYVGILRYIRGVLISQSRNFSLHDVAMKLGAWPWYTAVGAMADQITTSKPTYGDIVPFPEGVKIEKRSPDLLPDAVVQQVAFVNSIIMDFVAPRATQGLAETGVRSAAHARTLADLGGVKFQYPSESFRNKMAKVLANDLMIYKNIVPDDMRLWSRTPSDEFDMVIDKKKLHPPFTFQVEFAPYSEEKEYTKHDDLERMVKSGIVNVKWARKQMSNVDWRQMEKDDHKAMVAADPAVQGPLSQMRSAMVNDAIQRIMTEKGIKTGVGTENMPMIPMEGTENMPMMEPGRSVVAPSSPKPLPGSADAMQNQLAAMRGPGNGQGEGGGGMRR